MAIELEALLTERLILKVLDGNSAGLVHDYYCRNREYLQPWEPWRTPEFYTVKYHQWDLQNQWEKINRGEMFKVWLFKKEDTCLSKVIGLVSLNNIIRGCFQSAHLGYGLDQQETKQGFMTEAAQAVVDFAWEVLRLHRLEANIMPNNKPSFRVVEKLGFHQEGLSCKYLQINGMWQDHVRLVLLNEKGCC